MPSNKLCFSLLAMLLALALSVETTLGEVECEKLDKETCAFAVSSTSKRCVLEKSIKRTGDEVYICRPSQIEAEKIKNWIETDKCIEACGLDRTTFGISSDSLLESRFTGKLCASQCYDQCPNVVDLYFNLAAGEGVFLPKLCEAHKGNARRGMSEIMSSGLAAPGPEPQVETMVALEPAMPPSQYFH